MNLSKETVYEMIVNSLTLATLDDMPYDGIQYMFPMSPVVFLTMKHLKEDSKWNTILSMFKYWLEQEMWPCSNTLPNPQESEKIDLANSQLKIVLDKTASTRNITVPLNTHYFYKDDSEEETPMYSMY